MSRRTRVALFVGPLLLVVYLAAPAIVRWWVDGRIQGAVGTALPAFSLTDRAGHVWKAGELRGKRVLLHFFRSHCHSCDNEAPMLRAFEGELPGDVVLLHVMLDRVLEFEPATTEATIAGKAFRAPVAMADGPFVDAFHSVRWSNVTPITYVVDAQGVVRFGLRGAQTRAAIDAALAAVR